MSEQLRSLIAGEWVDGTRDEVRRENPARPEEVIATFRSVDDDAVDRAASSAARTAEQWAATPIHDRAAVLARAAAALRCRADELGRDLTSEEGKTLAEGTGEVLRAAKVFDYFAAEADREIGSVFASPRRGEEIIVRQPPVGPVALITPWNFPIAIPAWKLGPALVYGNTVVWKPSPVTPRLAVRLAEVLVGAGLPDGVLHVLLGDGTTGARLLERPEIRACSFTGSTAVGRAILTVGVSHGVKVQAEMGGVNVAVVLADADLDLAADQVVSGAMRSTGQKCTATSRLVVERGVHDELLDRVVAGARGLVVGDPLHPRTDLGPVATSRQLAELAGVIGRARANGNPILVDGAPTTDPEQGYYVGPTVIGDIAPDDPLCHTEVFGPTLAVSTAESWHDALRLANAGSHGLTAAVFTRDLGAASEAVDALGVGIVHVNSETTGAEPHVPFGGIGDSGAGGREQGRAARSFYTETRTAYVNAGPTKYGAGGAATRSSGAQQK